MNESINQLINYFNSSGIPLQVTTIQTTDPFQFWMTLLLGSIGVFYLFSMLLGPLVIKGLTMLRLMIFKKMKKSNNGIIVIKHTNSDLFSQSMIGRDTMEKIQEALLKMNGKPIDLILYTPGGEIFSASYISRMLRNYPGKIRSIIPTYSMSGGTLLALSTDEIYMNDYSSLGPIDPQLGNLFKFGSARSWKEVLKIKGKKADDSSISFKFIGEQYTKSIKENIKGLLSDKIRGKELNNIVNFLTSGEIEHGFNITKNILRSKGLDIKDLSPRDNLGLVKLIKSMPQGVSYKV